VANVLTNLIPDAYAALIAVSRELVGFIPSVLRHPTTDRVAENQSVRVPSVPANTAGFNFVPQMGAMTAATQTISTVAVTITKTKAYPFSWTGEEQKSVDLGPGFLTLKQQQIAQAFRACVNEIETDLATATYQGASRAIGSAATTPFGTAGDFSDAANVRKILVDNGANMNDASLVIDTTAGAKLRGYQSQAHMVGSTDPLRQGVLLDMHGMKIRESAQVINHTAGTANATAAINSAGYAVGATTLTIGLPAGTGTIVTGDIITHARDTRKYVVSSADTDISNGGVYVLNGSGIRQAITTASSIVTTTASYTANCAFSRDAVVLATRLPAMPDQGDIAIDSFVMTDPMSGISFDIRAYAGVGMITYLVIASWGVKVIKSDSIAVLIG